MRILLPTTTQDGEFLAALNRIESWSMVLVPYDLPGSESCIAQDFWLGTSRNGSTLALVVVPYGIYEQFNPAETATAVLLDPPKQNEDSIAEILFRLYIARREDDRLSAITIDEILAAVQFPEYRPVASYLPEAPQSWLQLPAELVVNFTLSEGGCVTGGLFDEYRRDTLEDVLRIVCGPRQDGIVITYTLATREVLPLLNWNVDWPLARRGTAGPERREKVQGMLPWESETDCALLSIYQQVSVTAFGIAPPYHSKHIVRLRVGGLSQEEAVSNWHLCARALRRMKKDIPEIERKRESEED